MGRVPVTILGFRCERCEHEWIEPGSSAEPDECPACHSTSWNTTKGPLLTYEVFSNKIASTLKGQAPLTWTEIRTIARLPQKFPNNEWVHRLEQDIGLERSRDTHGIITWRITETLLHV